MSQVHPIEAQFAEFLADKKREGLSPWTVGFYQNAVQRIFLPWALERGVTDGRAVTVEQWNAYVDELRGRDLKLPSVQTYLRGLRIFLGTLGVPCLGKAGRKMYREPKAPRPLLDVLTREEIDSLEAVADNERDKLIVRVLANTGIRLSELTGLKPKDLHEISGHYYRLRVWGKGSKEREVAIDKPTFKRLFAYANGGGKRTYVFPALQHDRKSGGLVMLDGGRLSNNAVDKLFRGWKKATGITKKCTPHALRHAFATHALREGWRPMQLRDQLGHRDLSMLENVYAHLNPDDVSEEYDRVFGQTVHMEGKTKRRRIA